MAKDEFGNRMKHYEFIETKRTLMPLLPIVARMDGINFHVFTKDLKYSNGVRQAYDVRLSNLMSDLALKLAMYFNAKVAYTQSDEITLGWHLDNYDSQMFCGGKIQKLNSHLAARTTAFFNQMLGSYIPEEALNPQGFDARVFNLPNLTEATNVFLWREQDAARNSVSALARVHFSNNQVFHKRASELREMLLKKNINWSDCPGFFKRGIFYIRKQVNQKFTAEEINKLPSNHDARNDPDLMIERSKYIKFDNLPRFSRVANREEFLFGNAEYQLSELEGT